MRRSQDVRRHEGERTLGPYLSRRDVTLQRLWCHRARHFANRQVYTTMGSACPLDGEPRWPGYAGKYTMTTTMVVSSTSPPRPFGRGKGGAPVTPSANPPPVQSAAADGGPALPPRARRRSEAARASRHSLLESQAPASFPVCSPSGDAAPREAGLPTLPPPCGLTPRHQLWAVPASLPPLRRGRDKGRAAQPSEEGSEDGHYALGPVAHVPPTRRRPYDMGHQYRAASERCAPLGCHFLICYMDMWLWPQAIDSGRQVRKGRREANRGSAHSPLVLCPGWPHQLCRTMGHETAWRVFGSRQAVRDLWQAMVRTLRSGLLSSVARLRPPGAGEDHLELVLRLPGRTYAADVGACLRWGAISMRQGVGQPGTNGGDDAWISSSGFSG
jgi:hypothetical protein